MSIQQTENTFSSEKNVIDFFYKYLSYWKWFVFSTLICLTIGYIKIKITPPIYESGATILIKDEEKGGGSLNELSAIQDLGIVKGGNKVENEIEILSSRRLIENVVSELKLNVQFLSKEGFLENEKYTNPPFKIYFLGNENNIENII